MNRAYEHHQEASREVVLRDVPISYSRFEIVRLVDCIFMKLRSIMGISCIVAKLYCSSHQSRLVIVSINHIFDIGFDTACALISALIAWGSLWE